MLVLSLGFVLALAGTVRAGDPPHTLRYQARLLDGSGDPVDQVLDVTFRIHDSELGGVALYTEAHTVANPSLPPVAVSQGLLSVLVGTSVPAPPRMCRGRPSPRARSPWTGSSSSTRAASGWETLRAW